MVVQDTSLYADIVEIASTPSTHVEEVWEVILRTPNEEILLTHVQTLSVVRDYVEAFTDDRQINFNIGIGTYVSRIYPFKANLYIDIIHKPLVQGSKDTLDDGKVMYTSRYRAILKDQSSLGLRSGSTLTTEEEAGDRSRQIPVTMQLVDPILDDLRVTTISGIFSGEWKAILQGLLPAKLTTSPLDVRTNLTSSQSQVQMELAGVDVRDVDNKTIPKQVLIPTGTKVTNLAEFIQNKYGLYEHALGNYVERGVWYIWGLYNTGLYSNSNRTLTVALVDTNTLPLTDNSYRVKNGHVNIVATGNVNHIDITESLLQNFGNGVRHQNANGIIDNYASTVNGKTSVSRTANMSEYLVESRKDGLNHAPIASASSNSLRQLSELNSRRGTVVIVNWTNSDPNVLRPGLPTKILYANKDNVTALNGILIGCQHAYVTESDMLTDVNIRCTSALSVWVERDETA